ncbi:hypothetical protein [Rouxiella sp. WC2420]|uniref:Uncharacterized protein n=1 Tax=Rouxiella sp. WC2420 TaxID=3234145 RepID=A0AB39VX33_9GAMM
MVLSPLQKSIIDFCCEKFKNRHGRICFIDWFPAEWSKVEINIALEDMRHQGIIYSTSYEESGFEDGFVLNMP